MEQTNKKQSFWDKKPFEKNVSTPGEEKSVSDILNEKPSWLSFDYDFAKMGDIVRFIIIFCVMGLIVIFLGDALQHITFKITGTFMIIIGALLIVTGFVVPVVKWLNDNM